MASRLFFDPLVALRTAPLVSSTCTLLFAWDQHLFLSNLNLPDTRALSKPVVRPYFRCLFRRSIAQVLGFVAVTAAASAANLRAHRPSLSARGSAPWYAAGALLAAGHLLFVPIIAPRVRALVQDAEVDPNDVLDKWLSVHAVRSLTVDLAAWVACAVAVGKTFVV
ncbi:hypothetical protein VUR80DRAFT_9180 [Thermomyces stellatus]